MVLLFSKSNENDSTASAQMNLQQNLILFNASGYEHTTTIVMHPVAKAFNNKTHNLHISFTGNFQKCLRTSLIYLYQQHSHLETIQAVWKVSLRVPYRL